MSAGNVPNRGPALIGIACVFTGLAWLAIGLRLFSRLKLIHSSGLDDLFIFIAMILSTINSSLFIAAAHAGVGKHTLIILPATTLRAIKFETIAIPFGIMATAVPKISIVLLLKRIKTPTKRQAIILWTIAIAINIVSAINVVIVFVQCTPQAASWNPSIMPRRCWSPTVLTDYSVFQGSLSAFSDIFLAFYPITIFWNLQIRMARKVGLCAIMSLGSIAGICAALKTANLYRLADDDYTWNIFELDIWGLVEINLIIIAASLPTLLPFVRYVRGQPVDSRDIKNQYNSQACLRHRDQSTARSRETVKSSGVISSHGNESVDFGEQQSVPMNNIRRTTELHTEWQAV